MHGGEAADEFSVWEATRQRPILDFWVSAQSWISPAEERSIRDVSASYNVLYKSTIIVLHVCIYRIKLASPTQFHSPVAGFPARREKQAYILSTRICTKIAARFFSSTPLQIPSLKQSCIPCVLDSNIDTRTIYTTYNIYQQVKLLHDPTVYVI